MELDQSFEISPLEESRHLHHVCDHCSYSTADKSNFNKHIRRHTAKIVAVTDTATSSVSKAKISNKDEHQGDDSDTHLCQICGKTFKSKFGLSLHIKNKHTFSFKHQCKLCDKGFNQTVQYRYHCSSHFQVPLDKCSFCKTEFTSHGSLKRHLETGNNIKANTFVCDVCQSSFPQKYRLNDHIKGKHQLPRYSCEVCGKKFGWRSSLKFHLKHSHDNEPFE